MAGWDWLHEQFGIYLDQIRASVSHIYERNSATLANLPFYTPHDTGHCERVENRLHELIPDQYAEELDEWERFYLLASAWLHDLGMLPYVFQTMYPDEPWPPRENEIRRRHPITVADYVVNHWTDCGLQQVDKDVLSELCRFHSRQESIDGWKKSKGTLLKIFTSLPSVRSC
jgi:hypothetical protein